MCGATERAELDLPLSLHSPAAARQFLRDATCPEHSPARVLDDAVLLVSELVTNSVLYGGPPIVVAVDCHESAMQVRVRDGAPGLPVPGDPGPDDENGRGLALMEMLSEDWGVDAEPAGKYVWFRVR